MDQRQFVDSEVRTNDRDDGIVEVFLDRFTTIFKHERIYLQDIPHDYLSAEDAAWSDMANSPAAGLAEEFLGELNGNQEHPHHVSMENGSLDNGKKKKKPKKKGAKETFKEELEEYIQMHTPEPMSSSDYEEELGKWI